MLAYQYGLVVTTDDEVEEPESELSEREPEDDEDEGEKGDEDDDAEAGPVAVFDEDC